MLMNCFRILVIFTISSRARSISRNYMANRHVNLRFEKYYDNFLLINNFTLFFIDQILSSCRGELSTFRRFFCGLL